MLYSTRRFVVCLSVCHFVLVFFSPCSIAITSLGEEKANLSAFRTFVRFVLVLICRFPLPLGVWEGLRFVILALPGLFSYLCLRIQQLSFPIFQKELMNKEQTSSPQIKQQNGIEQMRKVQIRIVQHLRSKKRPFGTVHAFYFNPFSPTDQTRYLFK